MVLEYSAPHSYLHAFNLCTQLAVTLIKIRTQLECLVRGAGAAEVLVRRSLDPRPTGESGSGS